MSSSSYFFSHSVIGTDVHKKTLVCCARRLQGDEWVTDFSKFGTTKNEIFRMVTWCKQYDPDFVIMESTSVYWVSPYNSLERNGLPVYIVNPYSVKGMIGNKTDKNDAKWLATKGNEGSFKPSYIPGDEWRRLRSLERYTIKLTNEINRLKNCETKMFLEMGYRLDSVFSDPFGVNAQRAKEAILAGKTPREVLSCININRLKASVDELLEAFSGDLDPERVRVINSDRQLRDTIAREIAEHRVYLRDKVEILEPQLLDLFQTIPGIGVDNAVNLIIEYGGSKFIEAFDSADKFASWLGVCPGNKESGTKRFKCRSGHGNSSARRSLCEAANAAAHTKGTTIQSRYCAQRAKIGTKKAIISTAHYIARLTYVLAKNRKPYEDPAIDYEAAAFDKTFKRCVKKAIHYKEKWQVDVIDLETGEQFQSKDLSTPATTVSSEPVTKAKSAGKTEAAAKAATAPKAATKTASKAKATPEAKAATAPKAATKTASKAKATPVTKTAAVVESTPAAKATPVGKTGEVVDAAILLKATHTLQTVPVVETTPTPKATPVVAAKPVAQTTAVVNATTPVKDAPLVEAKPTENPGKVIHKQMCLLQLLAMALFLTFQLAYVQNYADVNVHRAETRDSKVKHRSLIESLQIQAVANESTGSISADPANALTAPIITMQNAEMHSINRTRGAPTI